jgi:hypothetical protein
MVRRKLPRLTPVPFGRSNRCAHHKSLFVRADKPPSIIEALTFSVAPSVAVLGSQETESGFSLNCGDPVRVGVALDYRENEGLMEIVPGSPVTKSARHLSSNGSRSSETGRCTHASAC